MVTENMIKSGKNSGKYELVKCEAEYSNNN